MYFFGKAFSQGSGVVSMVFYGLCRVFGLLYAAFTKCLLEQEGLSGRQVHS